MEKDNKDIELKRKIKTERNNLLRDLKSLEKPEINFLGLKIKSLNRTSNRSKSTKNNVLDSNNKEENSNELSSGQEPDNHKNSSTGYLNKVSSY